VTDTLEGAEAPQESAPKRPNAWRRLYRGETSFDFVGRRWWWFTISSVIILAGVISLATRGLNLGIEFKGGTSWDVPSSSLTVSQTRDALGPLGLGSATIEVLGSGSHQTVEVQYNLEGLSQSARTQKIQQVSSALASAGHVNVSTVSINDVGPTWGGDVTSKAVRALIVFLIAIALYITIRFEWRMAVAALVAVVHDVLITAGIYSLTGFQVSPATVIAFLTILGYSLYDTIVVFDRVLENTKGLGSTGRITISDSVNLSMNQVLARSINTSLVAILPILSVLVLGAQVLGATTLQDFGLALFIGLTTGAYSSIFIASPLLAIIKEREPRFATIRQRLASRGDALKVLTPAAAAAGSYTGSGSRAAETGNGAARAGERRPTSTPRPGSGRPPTAGGRPGTRRPPPRPRKKGKRR
jgi:preprotein translocase subunit SecF